MCDLKFVLYRSLLWLWGLSVWLAGEQVASAQILLAQSAVKGVVGWGLVLLALVLGLIVVCRPGLRKGDWRK